MSLEGGDLPGGACEPRGSHSRGYAAPGLDRGADRCTRAPGCRREAAPRVTAVKRKWRRELAHASRGLEEPRPRGPARRHTARSRHSPSRSRSESRRGVVKGEWRGPAGSRTGSTDACRGPRGSGPGKPEEGSKDANLRGTGALVAAATAHHGSPGRPVPAALAAHRKRPARVIACDPRAGATDGSAVGTDWKLRSWMGRPGGGIVKADCFRPDFPEPEAGTAVAKLGGHLAQGRAMGQSGNRGGAGLSSASPFRAFSSP